jgi:TatD DNase family protein
MPIHLVDTHAHLNFASYKDDLDEVIERTRDGNVAVINVGSQYSTSQRAVELAKRYPGQMYAAVGLHPFHLFKMDVDEAELSFTTRQEEFSSEAYEKLARQPGVVAIGECGPDYFHKPEGVSVTEFKTKQKWTFLKQIQLAQKLNLPVIVHCRGEQKDMHPAYHDTAVILKDANFSHAVIHCYTGNWEDAKKFLDMGLMISFTGIITFPKTHALAEIIKKVSLDRIMVETDCPYLAPQLVRGQRNEPRFVRYVADRIAEIKGISYDEVAEQTTQNAIDFFKLKV